MSYFTYSMYLRIYYPILSSDDVKDRIESDWVARWRSAIGNPKKNPRWVMKTYLDLLDITVVDDLDEQMCWDCWPEGNKIDDVAANTPSK